LLFLLVVAEVVQERRYKTMLAKAEAAEQLLWAGLLQAQ
jgi:hypothetical protein